MSTKNETIVLSLKELKHTLPNLATVKKVNENVNKILQITIKGDKVHVETEVNVPATRTKTKVTTTNTGTTVEATGVTETATTSKTSARTRKTSATTKAKTTTTSRKRSTRTKTTKSK